MHKIKLELKASTDDSYEVLIEKGFLKKIASDLKMKRFAENYVIISDSKVGRLYASKLAESLKRENLFLGKIVFPAGEKSKSMAEMQEILEKMMEMGANRKTGVIALGGGVTGDLAGFVAASFMRGVPYIQVPTSLLAMVDSSVGGKVAVDLASGKNLVGAFWQPKKVYIDPEVLSTLPVKLWKAGLAEAVKYGAIMDRNLWEYFEKNEKVWNKDPDKFLPSEWGIVEEMIERCVQIKAEVVMKDEKEENLRQVLNYGHTFGHVIELMSGYKFLHGEAIATGMRIAGELAVRMKILPEAELKKQNSLLDLLGLAKKKTKGLIKDFIANMRKDKKAGGELKVVLVSRLGRCYQQLGKYDVKVDEKMIREVLEDGGWVDDVEKAPPRMAGREEWKDNTSYSSNLYSSQSSLSSQSSSSSYSEETDLQRRLREMRERAEQRRQSGGGGLGNGGYLPG